MVLTETPTHPKESTLQVNEDLLKACVHCGMCLPVCPTYQLTGSEAESPRGRLYLMRELQTTQRITPQDAAPHIDACLGCRACESACPSGVQYGQLLVEAKACLNVTAKRPLRKLKRFIYQHVLPNARLLQQLTGWLKFYQTSGLQKLIRVSRVLGLFRDLRWRESLMPTLSGEYKPLAPGSCFGNPQHPKVALMTGCVMDAFYNQVHWDTIHVLLKNDYYVEIPHQTCCGALAHHAGETDIALELARKNVSLVMDGNPDYIVTNSSGCGAMLQEYSHSLSQDPAMAEQAQKFSAKVLDIMTLLAQFPLNQPLLSNTIKATYHPPCHLYHAQGVQQEPLAVLHQLPGVEWVPLPEASTCCGSAGVYNLEQPEMSQRLLQQKMQTIDATGASVVVSGNPDCLLQIQQGANQNKAALSVIHPISLIAQAYRPENLPAGAQ
jgi:glycolate oxidase iron-sulfur subunit